MKSAPFLKEQKYEFVDRFCDDEWIAKLLFLADFFSHVNQLNSSMQGNEKKFLDVSGIDAFKAKIKLWMNQMESEKLAAFPVLNLFVEEKNIDFRVISRIFLEHLNAFVFELDRYISSHNYSKIFNWVRSPFEVSEIEVHSEMDCIAEQLIELQSRQIWRDKFKILFLTQFWAKEPNLSDLCKQATIALLQLHIGVRLAFQHWQWLKLSTETNFNQKTISDVH